MSADSKHTLAERLLYLVGFAGAGLGLLLVSLSILAYLFGYFGLFSFGLLFFAPSLFFIGAFGIVIGLFLAGFAQALTSLRRIAFFTEFPKDIT